MVKLKSEPEKRHQTPRQKREPAKWMENLAKKYGIEVDTVLAFFNSFNYNYARRQTKRERTEEFFELYFEGRNSK